MFPTEATATHPDLLLMAALVGRWFQVTHVSDLLDRAERLVAQMPDQPEHALHWRGKIDTLAVTAEAEPEDVTEDGAVHARLALSPGFIDWMAGNLQTIPRRAAHGLAVGETPHRRESLGWAHDFLSTVAYQRNDLPVAEAHRRTMEEMRYMGMPMAYVQSAFVYASIHQALGLPKQARQKLELAFDFVRETRSEGLLLLAQAFQAELAARQGDRASAEVLSRLHTFVTSTHNTRFTIDVLALQALLHHAQRNRQSALASLEQAVTVAQPGGFVRVFLDLDPALADLLGRLVAKGVARDYCEQILRDFAAERTGPRPETAVTPAGQPGMSDP
jgi:ATP/maltotriose-dependent transcriptional regulator MalT